MPDLDQAVAAARAVTEEVYRAELRKAWLMAELLMGMPLEEMIRLCVRAETIAPFVDPTLYRKAVLEGKAFGQDLELLRALRGVQQTVEKMKK